MIQSAPPSLFSSSPSLSLRLPPPTDIISYVGTRTRGARTGRGLLQRLAGICHATLACDASGQPRHAVPAHAVGVLPRVLADAELAPLPAILAAQVKHVSVPSSLPLSDFLQLRS